METVDISKKECKHFYCSDVTFNTCKKYNDNCSRVLSRNECELYKGSKLVLVEDGLVDFIKYYMKKWSE